MLSHHRSGTLERGIVGQGRHGAVCLGQGSAQVCGHRQTRRLGQGQTLRIGVVDRHGMATCHQMTGHGQAHLAHAQKHQLHALAIEMMDINWPSGLPP